jgi:hypothetical protein
MSSAKDFDMLSMAVDYIRRDECEHLFAALHQEDKEHLLVDRENKDYSDGYLDGLKFAMDELDVRIGHLRDRWG